MKKKIRKEWTRDERQRLHVMKQEGKSFQEIGNFLGRDWRVVKRAWKRYEPESPFTRRLLSDPYDRARHDHEEHKKRLRGPKRRVRLGNLAIQNYVEVQLQAGLSPEQIAGRIAAERGERIVCHETIYQWIYTSRRDLMEYLPLVSKRGRAKRSSQNQPRHREPAAPKRSISERENVVANRERFGDHERDTVKGPQGSKPCVLTIRERKSRIVMLEKLHDGTAEAAKSATIRRLKPLPKELRLTMTQDNGPENALHHEEEIILDMTQYFCHPYCAPERGSVENANRFAVRRAFPKGTDFTRVTLEQVMVAEVVFNNRPMKCLNFLTPMEVFAAELLRAGFTPEQVGLTRIDPIPYANFVEEAENKLRAAS